jgi:hypothetical protein
MRVIQQHASRVVTVSLNHFHHASCHNIARYKALRIQDQHRWNSGINRSIFGLLLSTRGMKAFLRGVPEGGVVYGTDDFLEQSSAFALGFFLFECRDSLQMHFSHGTVCSQFLKQTFPLSRSALGIHDVVGIEVRSCVKSNSMLSDAHVSYQCYWCYHNACGNTAGHLTMSSVTH